MNTILTRTGVLGLIVAAVAAFSLLLTIGTAHAQTTVASNDVTTSVINDGWSGGNGGDGGWWGGSNNNWWGGHNWWLYRWCPYILARGPFFNRALWWRCWQLYHGGWGGNWGGNW